MDIKSFETNHFLILAAFIIGIGYYFLIVRFWLRALLSGVKISQAEILFMRMRNSSVKTLVTGMIKSHKAGILLNLIELEAFHLVGGDVLKVVDGLIYAKAKKIDMDFQEASLIDLQKIDLMKYLINKK
ncbi:MAG: hypothetical protein CVU00_14860 [Bacteroidetes bacterium HGW-Bacteroidetes-17]|jgi:uncharacterized protein YqfA (UPF0365 family)|nr:MAG: hypothetical protein CVU00_14860 [Bacteroidetes bacterium HGW-Bacteroidetes-17]